MHGVALRVLITNHDLRQVGGTQLYTLDLAKALAERGHQPMVFSPRPGLVSDQLRRAAVPGVLRRFHRGRFAIESSRWRETPSG